VTYTVKHRGDRTATIVCVYTCPEHGEFETEVQRDETGSAPDHASCTRDVYGPCDACGLEEEAHWSDDVNHHHYRACGQSSAWTPQPITCRVKRFEVVRGGWEKPERKTFLDTRNLGEGQSMEEFKAERKKIWDEKRHADAMAFKRGY
jgi:hypothetical protein